MGHGFLNLRLLLTANSLTSYEPTTHSGEGIQQGGHRVVSRLWQYWAVAVDSQLRRCARSGRQDSEKRGQLSMTSDQTGAVRNLKL